MPHAAIYQSEHVTRVWPMLVGGVVLLTPLTVLAYFAWRMPMVSVVLGGGSLALLAVGFACWAKEFF